MKAVVLSGGGANGAYQAGALKYILGVMGVQPDIICGTSVGSINGSFLAQFKKGEEIRASLELISLWKGINTACIYKKWYHGLLWHLPVLWKESVYNTSPIQKLLRENLDQKKIAESGRKLRVVGVSFTTGECRRWEESDENIIDGVLASSSFPIFFQPVMVDGVPYTDGGLRDITPLNAAIELGATEVYIVTCQTPAVAFKPKPGLKVLDQIPRALSIMTNEINRNDLRKTQLYNELCRAGKAPGKKEIDLKLVQDQRSLGDSLDFSLEKNRALIDLGYSDAEKQLGTEKV